MLLESNISGKTKLAALLGRPVSHSISPQMHNTAFAAKGIDCVYLCFDSGEDNLPETVGAMRALNVLGFNVTMPNKQSVMKYLDEISEDAKLIGAVNTVKNDNGRLTGYNTDGMGFVKSLDDSGIVYKGQKVVICGAGGAGRAVSVALSRLGVRELLIFDIRLEAAQDLSEIVNNNTDTKASAHIYNEEALTVSLIGAAVLINCTGLGMAQSKDKSIITSAPAFPDGIAVADVIYDPYPTKLLSLAREAGLKTVNGFGMLYNQGAYAFKIWTGQDMPLDCIKNNTQ